MLRKPLLVLCIITNFEAIGGVEITMFSRKLAVVLDQLVLLLMSHHLAVPEEGQLAFVILFVVQLTALIVELAEHTKSRMFMGLEIKAKQLTVAQLHVVVVEGPLADTDKNRGIVDCEALELGVVRLVGRILLVLLNELLPPAHEAEGFLDGTLTNALEQDLRLTLGSVLHHLVRLELADDLALGLGQPVNFENGLRKLLAFLRLLQVALRYVIDTVLFSNLSIKGGLLLERLLRAFRRLLIFSWRIIRQIDLYLDIRPITTHVQMRLPRRSVGAIL